MTNLSMIILIMNKSQKSKCSTNQNKILTGLRECDIDRVYMQIFTKMNTTNMCALITSAQSIINEFCLAECIPLSTMNIPN